MGGGGAIDFNLMWLPPVHTIFPPPQISAPRLNGQEPHPLLIQRDSNILYTYIVRTHLAG